MGELDRDGAVEVVRARLGARRSAWNAADARGEVEQWVARTGLVADVAVRLELTEDLTARVVSTCVRLLTRTDGSPQDVPEHIRALTSREVLAVEDDLTTRMIARAETAPAHVGDVARGTNVEALDAAQQAVCDALAGRDGLVVVEGAAGVGKTTTLSATRDVLERQGHRLVVATPTLKAASVAARETGTSAYSAAWLAHQHGYRWDDHGTWTRLRAGDADPHTGATYQGPVPEAVLREGELLLVDEAGMLDQDTARALFVIADEQHARLALVGDRHQLPAVGRGGVLDLAARWASPDACLVLDTVHRFRDEEYARLTLSMRTGEHPGQVFDALLARGEIRIHRSDIERAHMLAEAAADEASGEPCGEATSEATSEAGGEAGGERGRVLVIADTREQVAALNATIRDRLLNIGRVDDTAAVTTDAGERIGIGDRVATRRNDRRLDVANRATWTVTGVDSDGTLTVDNADNVNNVNNVNNVDNVDNVAVARGPRRLPPGYVREHLELAYATTVYGAQGETVGSAHLLVGEHTGAAAAYVAMTRGRSHNVAHLVAETVEEARNQWMATFGRDRADLGPTHAARLAAEAVDRYGTHRPLDRVLVDLRRAWSTEEDLCGRLRGAERWRDRLAAVVPLRAEVDRDLADHLTAADRCREGAEHARARFDRVDGAVTADADRLARALHETWQAGFPGAFRAAQTVRAGAGPLGLRREKVRRARGDLEAWAQTWRPVLPGLPADPDRLAVLLIERQPHSGTPHLREAFSLYARRTAEQNHPDLQGALHNAATTTRQAAVAEAAYTTAAQSRARRLHEHGSSAYIKNPALRLTDAEQHIGELDVQLQTARARVDALRLEPAIRALPPGRLATERDLWQQDSLRQRAANQRAALTAVTDPPTQGTGANHDRRQPPSLAPRQPDRGFSR